MQRELSHLLQIKFALCLSGKTRNMYRFCGNKWNHSLRSATTFCNLKQPDLLQDRFDSGVVKRAKSLFNFIWQQCCKTFQVVILPRGRLALHGGYSTRNSKVNRVELFC